MALDPPFVVRVEKQPGGSSFGDTMNNIRSWLDHRKIQPASFNSVFNALSGVGFEIAFNGEDEAHLFEDSRLRLDRFETVGQAVTAKVRG
jgi:hypothetical protein